MTITEFKKRVNNNGGCDREIGKWQIIDIHLIPEVMQEQHEVDFYCCDGIKVYLLRLRNQITETYHIVESDKYPPYLIAELPITAINDELILKTLDKFDTK